VPDVEQYHYAILTFNRALSLLLLAIYMISTVFQFRSNLDPIDPDVAAEDKQRDVESQTSTGFEGKFGILAII
jgi:hypothetical protein